jgi:hypothetical protein
VIVSLAEGASAVRLRYRMAPGRGGDLDVTVTSVGSAQPAASWSIAWHEGDWCEQGFAASLAPGDYLVTFESNATWSNEGQVDATLPPENRALGFALASIGFD